MVNNKKKRTKIYRTGRRFLQKKKELESLSIHEEEALGISQLIAIIFLAVGTSYTFEYMKAAREGETSLVCGKYLVEYAESKLCSESDIYFILLKSNSAILCSGLAFFTVLMSWSDTPLLNRLIASLCVSPLAPTLAALQSGFRLMNVRQVILMTILCIVLLFVSLPAYQKGFTPLRTEFSLQNASLFCVISASAWYAFTIMFNPEMILTIDPESVTKESMFLLKFIGIDWATFSLIHVCILLFFDENRKRSMMLVSAVCAFYHLKNGVEAEAIHLRYLEETRKILFAFGTTLSITSVLPAIQLKKDKKTN